MDDSAHLPVPFFLIAEDLTILASSPEAQEIFPDATSFLELVDAENYNKALRFLSPAAGKIRLELPLHTRSCSLVEPFDLHVAWNEQSHGYVVCLAQDPRINQLMGMMINLRKRLAETDFSLLEKKEELENALIRMEESAVENDKLAVLGKMAAGIAHEIRNPLTIIRGFVQLLHPHLVELGKADYTEVVLTEIDRANQIIAEFLDSSRPSEPMRHDVTLKSLLEDVHLLCQSEALLNGCELELVTPDVDRLISADPKQLKQVFLNIIKNAMEAIAESGNAVKGVIAIKLAYPGNQAVIEIRDNGKGMSEQTLRKLFDPFFTTKATGTGLGLAVCKRIIINHSGTLVAESTEGVGTLFRIALPTHA